MAINKSGPTNQLNEVIENDENMFVIDCDNETVREKYKRKTWCQFVTVWLYYAITIAARCLKWIVYLEGVFEMQNIETNFVGLLRSTCVEKLLWKFLRNEIENGNSDFTTAVASLRCAESAVDSMRKVAVFNSKHKEKR